LNLLVHDLRRRDRRALVVFPTMISVGTLMAPMRSVRFEPEIAWQQPM